MGFLLKEEVLQRYHDQVGAHRGSGLREEVEMQLRP